MTTQALWGWEIIIQKQFNHVVPQRSGDEGVATYFSVLNNDVYQRGKAMLTGMR
uniref:Uncharacterized protein n=1 Tax=mine drainage metagenome TaxID=410659 RepID=E6QJB1_9ZZZZ